MTAPEGPSFLDAGQRSQLQGAALLLADVVDGRELVGSDPGHGSFAGDEEVVFNVGDLRGSARCEFS